MPFCSFCGESILKGKGVMYIKKDGKFFYFCSSKCKKNTKLKREGRRKKWTKTYVKFTGKKKSEKK